MKILVRATNWVGDAIMSVPALEAIRRARPDAEITIFARPWVADLYRGQAFADRIIEFDSTGSGRGPLALEHLARALRREKFDRAVLLQNAFQAAWIAWRARIQERIGYARDARSWLLTRAIRVPRHGEIPAHEAYYYLELLRRARWIDRLPVLEPIRLRVDPAAVERADSRLRDAGAPAGAIRIAIAPGAAFGSAKCWDPGRYAALADRLIADFGAIVILFGTASEREVTERIAALMRFQPVNLAGKTPVGELPALFAACNLFVGNDSGAMHVAAAVGLPVVAIFGPTDPEGTAPVTPQQTLVQQHVSCSPCFLRHCPVDHRCMTRVTVDAVYAAARAWMEQLARV
jgi:heptosyltransferase-2